MNNSEQLLKIISKWKDDFTDPFFHYFQALTQKARNLCKFGAFLPHLKSRILFAHDNFYRYSSFVRFTSPRILNSASSARVAVIVSLSRWAVIKGPKITSSFA